MLSISQGPAPSSGLSYKTVLTKSSSSSYSEASSSCHSYEKVLEPISAEVSPSDEVKSSQKRVWEKKEVVKREDEVLTSQAALDSFDSEVRAYRPDPRETFRKYNGKITSGWKLPQYVFIQDVADQILFFTRTVSDSNFSKQDYCDYPLDFLADSLFMEFRRDINKFGDGALDIVDMGGDVFTSVDNRRLLIAKKIGQIDRFYGIWVKVHSADETLPRYLQYRFNGAKSWGEAVRGRMGNSKQVGYKAYPTIMTTNKLEQRVRAESQQIPLSVMGCNLSELHSEDVAMIRRNRVSGIIHI